MLAALEKGFFRREIADARSSISGDVDAKRKLLVGVNAFAEGEEKPIDISSSIMRRWKGPSWLAQGPERRSAILRRCGDHWTR